jgi:hypothetical protein
MEIAVKMAEMGSEGRDAGGGGAARGTPPPPAYISLPFGGTFKELKKSNPTILGIITAKQDSQ